MKKKCNGWTIKWRKKVVICAERLGACVEGFRKKTACTTENFEAE